MNQEDNSVSPTEQRREAARWRIAAAWSVPLALVVGDTEDEMEQAAASHRRDWCLPGLNRRR